MARDPPLSDRPAPTARRADRRRRDRLRGRAPGGVDEPQRGAHRLAASGLKPRPVARSDETGDVMTFIEGALLLAGIIAVGLALEHLAPQRMATLWLALERRRAGLTLKRQRLADNIEMPYLEGGRGEPLLLVHGFGGDKDNFTRVAGRLVRHYRVIIPDLPGFGDASRDLN